MKSKYSEMMDLFFKFKKLNVSDILPDISKGEFGILMSVKKISRRGGKRAKVSEIIGISHCSASAVSRTMGNLEKKGYIIRSADEKDRRNTYVDLTESGSLVLEETENILDDFLESVFRSIQQEELDLLYNSFSKLYEVCKIEINNRKYSERKR